MNTRQMLKRLQFSQNDLTASIASRIIEGRETIKEAKISGYGAFMQAVLSDDYDLAMSLADLNNQRCLGEEYEYVFVNVN